MINGIPVKVKIQTEAGADCETAFFATYRKCPALADRTKRIARLEVDVKTAERMKALAAEKLDKAATAQEVEDAAIAMRAAVETSMAAQDAIVAEFEAFAVDGFLAAGYDEVNAARIAAAVPMARMGELVGAARVGSGVVDFFGE